MRKLLIEQMTRWGHALRLPFLTAVAWRLASKEASGLSQTGRAARKLIVLARNSGMDDLRAAFDTTPADFKIYALPRELVKRSCRHFLGDRVSDAKYLTDDRETEERKLEYRAYLLGVLEHYRRFFGCDAILQFNVAYHAERELAAASSAAGIPFICIYKECLRSDAFWQETRIYLRRRVGSFHGWKIAVYNQQARQALIDAGVASARQIESLGCARLDDSHRLRQASDLDATSRKTVLFFLVQETAGLPYFGGSFLKDGRRILEGDGECLDWRHLANATNDVMLEFASKNPDIDFVFKGKTGHARQQRKRLGEALPSNVSFIGKGTAGRLLERASVVVGFQTTAVLEAIAAGKPTIVPALLGAREEVLKPYLHELDGAAVIVGTPAELEQALAKALRNPQVTTELSENQRRVLMRYLGNDDGAAGRRLRRFIEAAVDAEPGSVRLPSHPGP